MKKILLFLLVIPVFFSLSLKAKTTKTISIGLTRATLRSEGGKSYWGEYVGLGLEQPLPLSFFGAMEVAYAARKVTLENKTWPLSYDLLAFNYVHIGNIDIHYTFFEFALKMGYRYPIFNNKLSVKLFIGPSLSKQLKYIGKTRENMRTIILEPEEKGKYKFDYVKVEESGYINSINSIMGISLSYRFFEAELRVERCLVWETTGIWGLGIYDKMDCVYFLLHYRF